LASFFGFDAPFIVTSRSMISARKLTLSSRCT